MPLSRRIAWDAGERVWAPRSPVGTKRRSGGARGKFGWQYTAGGGGGERFGLGGVGLGARVCERFGDGPRNTEVAPPRRSTAAPGLGRAAALPDGGGHNGECVTAGGFANVN